MKTRTLLPAVVAVVAAMAATAFLARAATDNGDPKSAVAAAAQALAAKSSFSWTTTTRAEAAGPFGGGGGTTTGRTERDGYTHVTSADRGGFEFVTKGDKAAVLVDENWQTPEQAAGRPATGGAPAFDARTVSGFKPPPVQAQEYLALAQDLRRDGNAITGTLSPEAATQLLNAAGPAGFGGGRGGRGNGRRGGGSGGAGIINPRGTVSFTIKDGVLTGFVLSLGGSRELRGGEIKLDRTVTTIVSDVSAMKVTVPPDAKEIVDALTAGRSPNVFVPEPGFKKLFNGHDLTGWAGRPEHWSVVDGAITGKTTADKPARGNNFLIARNGEENLVVSDFELRLSYRITPNNDAGFANSGVQYRSVAKDNFVVAGYQADIDAANQYTGILYDEGGGAGGRNFLGRRGEVVAYAPDGKRTVTGHLASDDEIRKAIKPSGEWNDYVIIARGNRLQHFINGAQTVDVTDDAEGKGLTSGVLALQLHAGEPMTVQFKDVRIRTLSPVEATGVGGVRVPKDFRLDMVYLVPRETQGSWVAMCFDPKGRLIVSDQNGALHRVTLPEGGAGAVKTERIDLNIGGAHGLLYAFDSLYVMVNEGSRPHGLYRVRDTEGDDRFDDVKLLRQITASGEHGAHSIVPSPDGKSLFVVVGNQSTVTKVDSSRAPMVWGEDDLLQRLPTGFMDDSYAPQGWIARTDPDGREWELIAVGMRNPFDIAFNRDGELFTYDADMEWDIGEPWYRPTRVNHVISGAEYGFRNGNGKWPDYYIDSFGAAANVGPGSPTGITFGYGAKFPAKYQNALFLADWSFGKLRAVHLRPQGASYVGEVEEFLSGQPLPVTDVLVNPRDGAMYFAVGGRNAQSALYRLSYVGNEPTGPSQPSAASADDTAFRAKRELRHLLEAFHGRKDPKAVETAWPYLGDADRAIRFAARTAVEWQDTAGWRDRALNERDARRAIAALVALARVSGRDAAHRNPGDPQPDDALRNQVLAALDKIEWPNLSTGDQVDLLRAYSLAFSRLGRPDDAARARLVAKFDPIFPSKSRELNALLSQILIYLESPGAATKVIAALKAAPTQEEQIHYAIALRGLKAGWTMPLREDYFRWFVKAASYRGGNTFASSMRTAKNQAVANLGADERAALRPIIEQAPPQRSLRDVIAARPRVKEWTVAELVPVVEQGMKGGRDFDRGRRLYGDVGCAACHRFGQEGGAVGPELTGVGGRFTPRDLLESIVEPSKTISDQYAAVMIRKKNGQIVTGRVGNLQGANVSVIEDMFAPGTMTSVRQQDIDAIKPSPVSMMPQGLLDSLKEEEIQDLAAYLLSGGDPNHAAFR